MKIRIGVSLFVLFLFILLGIDRYNDSNEVSSIAQTITIEETREIKGRAYNFLSEKHKSEIDDIYNSELVAFKSAGKYIIYKNEAKVNIQQIQTTLVNFNPNKESKLKSIDVYLDEDGKEFLGYKVKK